MGLRNGRSRQHVWVIDNNREGRFFGQRREVELLSELLEGASRWGEAPVGGVGEAEIGKTALLDNATETGHRLPRA